MSLLFCSWPGGVFFGITPKGLIHNASTASSGSGPNTRPAAISADRNSSTAAGCKAAERRLRRGARLFLVAAQPIRKPLDSPLISHAAKRESGNPATACCQAERRNEKEDALAHAS